ncbi:MAG: AAA family ATPase [Clostridiaceae bacterium]|nr:AAA family ATPase [Clostridiaceae bacterium]
MEVLKPIAIEKGYFAYGKFDQLQQNIPYSPFVTALESLIRQLMTESKEQLAIWKQKILRTLGKNGAIITDLIPELEMIIGRQSPVESLQPKEAQNRFLMLFGSFIKIFADPERPLVLFLDDLQWADSSSLRLISYLCRDTGLKGLIIAGAYRENEIAAEHPFHAILDEIKKDGIMVKEIYLPPLNRAVTAEFIAGVLCCNEKKAEALAEILYRKTCGIPFFIGQLLKFIYKENLIEFNMNKGCWEWDAESIYKLQINDDVIAFMLDKLQKFHEETRRTIKFASCIGDTFDLKILSEVMEKTSIETVALLMPAILEGLILQVCRSENGTQLLYLNNGEDTYEFLHDMVRQTAYSMIPEEEKNVYTLK